MIDKADQLWQIKEYAHCRENFWYFLTAYCRTQDNKDNKVKLFPKFPYAEKVANKLQFSFLPETVTPENIAINKCRQMAVSWLLSAYSLWRITFFENWNIPMISKVGESAFDGTPQSFGGKVIFIWEHLPGFLKEQFRVTMIPKKIVNPALGSGLHMFNATDDAGRGGSGTEFIGDEAAFWEHAELILSAIAPSVKRMILNSTFNGDNPDQPYYAVWSNKNNGWAHLEIDYFDHPEHTKETYDAECVKLNNDKQRIAQELDRNPSASLSGKMFEYDREKHVEELPEGLLRAELLGTCAYSGHDIGYTDGHAYILAYLRKIQDEYHLYVYNCYYQTGKGMKDITADYKKDAAQYPHAHQQDFADPTIWNKKQEDEGASTTALDFSRLGLTFIKSSNDHRTAIIEINQLLHDCTIHFHPRCEWLLKALAYAHYPCDRTGRITDYDTWVHDKYSHVLCALSYVVLQVFSRIGRRVSSNKQNNETNAYGELIRQGNKINEVYPNVDER